MTLEKQSNTEILEAAPGHGGYRPGSGRKLGSTQKLSAKEILEAITSANNGVPYEVILANDFLAARYEDDKHLVAKYHQLILSKVIADKVDITSNGQTLQSPTLNFAPKEIPDYIETDVKEITTKNL